MAKRPSAANQDYYKVGGRSPQPNEHDLQAGKRAVANDPANRAKKVQPPASHKEVEPGKNAGRRSE